MQEKKLRRSNNKIISGVCAGLAEYTGMDPMMMRILFAVGTVITGGFGVLVYIVLIFVMPAADDMTATPGGGAGMS